MMPRDIRPSHPRFRIVEELRMATLRAEACGGLVSLPREDPEPGEEPRRLLAVRPAVARQIADEFERRWTS